MTTPSTPVAPRRGSFLETWRLFADGWRRAAIVGLVILGSVVLATAMMPAGKDPVRFSGFMILATLPWGTWAIERQGSNRLAFMSLVPQPVPPKWLVLAPMSAIAAVTAAATSVLGHRPAVAGLAALGSACG